MASKGIRISFTLILLLSFSIMSLALPGNHLYHELNIGKQYKSELSISDPVKCNYLVNDLIGIWVDHDDTAHPPETDPVVQPVLSAYISQYTNIAPRCILLNTDLLYTSYSPLGEFNEKPIQNTVATIPVRLKQPSYYAFLFRLTPF
ncbi:MAG: hypothetical protein J0I41_15255 [Filimonas sp.]|nr:hypothetical protein [Filimonas sp.]